MRRGGPPFGQIRVERQGYTIVEVMIFMAVTGLLFVMIALTFAGQRGRTEFQTGAREFESRIRDIINDTSTGFYNTDESFACAASVSGPVFTTPLDPDEREQGANQACIFIGRAFQFDAGGDPNRYDVFTVAGLRREATEDKEVENFDEAKPQPVIGSGIHVTEELALPHGAEVATMFYNDGGANIPITGVGLFTTFGRYEDGALQPGSLSVNVVPFPVAGSTCASGNFPCQITELGTVPDGSIIRNPSNGITICFDSVSSGQHARLTIGGTDRQLTTDLVIADDASSGDPECDI